MVGLPALQQASEAEAARSTSEGVTEAQQASTDLARMSSDLRALVANFRY